MVKTNGVAILLLTAASAGTVEQARAERSWFGKKISKADHIRVQEARLRRLEERIEKMSAEGALLAERTRQHREMRVKSNEELRNKVSELKAKLEDEEYRIRRDFEEKLVSAREEMWAQAARDRDALEAELGARHQAEREKLLEGAREDIKSLVERVRAEMAEEAERERELYAQRVALAEEGQELARKDQRRLQEEKDELARQLQENVEVEDANRKKLIVKFKSRENVLRKNFEAQLRETRAEASEKRLASNNISTRSRPSSPGGTGGVEATKRAAIKSPSANGSTLPSKPAGTTPPGSQS